MERYYIRGDDVYPGGLWAEGMEPIYTMVYFMDKPKYKETDYPEFMHKHVRDANVHSDIDVMHPLCLGTASSQHGFETSERFWQGTSALNVYDASEGYTKTGHIDNGGFVFAGSIGSNDFENDLLDRIKAKSAADWGLADAIKKSMAGILLQDRLEGTVWFRNWNE